MQVVRYYFSNGINCLFELPTDAAKKLLPKGIEPIEVTHGTSLLAVTMFNFTESPIGPYQELVISLFVVPLLGIRKKHPHSAVFPLVVASGSQRARDHAIDLWHLPHFNEDINIEFIESQYGNSITGKVCCHKGQPIVELTITQSGEWDAAYQLYQSFQHDESGSYIGIMDMQGSLSEHEEHTGTIHFHEHRFFNQLDLSAIDDLPFREMWMKDGVESYHELISLSGVSAVGCEMNT